MVVVSGLFGVVCSFIIFDYERVEEQEGKV